MQGEISKVVQRESEKEGVALPERVIKEIFESYFVNRHETYALEDIVIDIKERDVCVQAKIVVEERTYHDRVCKGGVIEAASALFLNNGIAFEVLSYYEHALGEGADAKAVAYFSLQVD
jgi:2-isopropylmalate synthase